MNDNSYTQGQENSGRGSRKRARTRAELLAAARQVFAANGYHEASIAEITRLADVGVGTFYLHFRDKDEIFTTLIEEGIRDIREQVTAEAFRLSYEQRLPAIIRLTLRYAYAKRDLFRIALTDGGQLTRKFRAQTALIEGFTDILEEAQRRGLVDNASLFARFITGIVMQGIVWWFEHDEPQPDIMAEQIMRLLRHGLPASFLSEDDDSSKG
jgi:AcrR family transcriptional regulator